MTKNSSTLDIHDPLLNPLLDLVEQTIEICSQALATCQALESLLIDKGVIRQEELDARIVLQKEMSQKIVSSLTNPKAKPN